MKVSIEVQGIDELARKLNGAQKQVRFAASGALNDVAFSVMRKGREKMGQIFDRPTAWTLRSWYVRKRATRDDLAAMVGLSDYTGGGRISLGGPDKKLHHHFFGRSRSRKGLEMHLQSRGLMKSGEFLVPGAGARLDSHGNVSRGQVAQIVSQLKIGENSESWATSSKRSRGNVSRAGRIFWSAGPEGAVTGYTVKGGEPVAIRSRASRLPRGIWIAKGGTLRALFIVVDRVLYRKIFDLDEFGARIMRSEFEPAFAIRWARALESAR